MNSSEDDLLEVAWYLSKYGKSEPPVGLVVQKWKEAIALFYPHFGAGKTVVGFYNSLKNSGIVLIPGLSMSVSAGGTGRALLLRYLIQRSVCTSD